MKSSFPRIAAFVFLALAPAAFLAAEAPLAGSPSGGGRAALAVELVGGPVLGMDRLLRGGGLGFGLGLAAGNLSASLRAEASYDVSLGAFLADAGLALGLGDGIRFVLGGQFPLGSPKLAWGGERWPIAAAPWPNRFALAVPLARLAEGDGARPALSLDAELSYSAYRVEAGPSGATQAGAGVAGFAAGFRARLALRLSWAADARRRP